MEKTAAQRFLPFLRSLAAQLRKELMEIHGFPPERAAELLKQVEADFLERIPELPEVGADNPWLNSLLGVSYLSGLWLTLEKEGWTPPGLSVLSQSALSALVTAAVPEEALGAVRERMLSPETAEFMEARSAEGKYPGDWQVKAVLPSTAEPGQSQDGFSAGYDIYACPILKYCRQKGLERFMPYFCLDDYPIHAAMGIELRRTMTLAGGAPCCDFRLYRAEKRFRQVIDRPEELAECLYKEGGSIEKNEKEQSL